MHHQVMSFISCSEKDNIKRKFYLTTKINHIELPLIMFENDSHLLNQLICSGNGINHLSIVCGFMDIRWNFNRGTFSSIVLLQKLKQCHFELRFPLCEATCIFFKEIKISYWKLILWTHLFANCIHV